MYQCIPEPKLWLLLVPSHVPAPTESGWLLCSFTVCLYSVLFIKVLKLHQSSSFNLGIPTFYSQQILMFLEHVNGDKIWRFVIPSITYRYGNMLECEDSVVIIVFKFLKVASFSYNDSLTSDVRHSIIAFTRTLCCDGLPKEMF